MNLIKRAFFCLLLPLTLTACSEPGEDEFNKGIEAERANNLTLAQHLYQSALTKDPTLAEAHINLGFVHLRNKQFDKAWQETTKGLELVQQTKRTIVTGKSWQDQAALAHNNLAKIEFEKALDALKAGQQEQMMHHKTQTLSLLRQALELVPEHEMALKNINYVERWPN